ncbi:hypothetical protein CK203_052807 [Vitis vinifera]|uniref:Uncharacterized protein n=1 Tax=Vitis vinifera TaxID=29760 RepID=A0A438GUW6_VITVI|nr:hypothetical protein CK203_052807 [Vitis vinifera]
MLRGGRSRFVVESKWFEIVVEELGGRLKGCIWERSRGFESWIRFGEASLRCLLEGVETCCREVDDQRWAIEWLEGNRKFRMERRLNKAGRFILCSVRDMEAKDTALSSLKGRVRPVDGILAVRLRGLGVTPTEGLKISNVPEFPVKPKGVLKVQWKEKGVEMKSFAEAVKSSPRRWVSQCVRVPPPELDFVRSWTRQFGRLRGSCRLPHWAGVLCCSNSIRLKRLSVFWPEAKEALRIIGLSWTNGIRSIGDGCGGFIAVDEGTKSMSELQWARDLVVPAGSSSGKGGLRAGEEVDGLSGWLAVGVKEGDGAVGAAGGDGTVERRWAGGPADLVGRVGVLSHQFGQLRKGAGRPKQELWPLSFQLAQFMQSIPISRGVSQDARGEVDPLVGLPRDSTARVSSQMMDRGLLTDEALTKRLPGEKQVAGEGQGGELRDVSGSGWVPVGRQLLGEETKIQEMSQGVIHSLGVGRFLGWGAVDARRAAGGGLQTYYERFREPFWEELGAIRGLWTDPWCIGGDFNVIKFPSERSRVGRLSGPMRRFSEVLDELALRDMPLQGRGPIPFRFENMWLKEEGFKELLRGWWQGFNYSGSYSFVLSEKLKALKDDQERQRTLNEQELEARKEAKEEFKKWAIMEEISWRQKSRQIWLKEGDKNTRGVVRAYQDLLSDPGGWHPSMSSLEFDSIGREEAARLEEMFSLEEVYLALSELNGDKAPGPDGFPIAFWQFFPKKSGAEDLRDYRPISLVGGLYKILAKVLANRLKKVVGKVVSSAQNAFVEGRQILDAALIANEAIDSMLKGMKLEWRPSAASLTKRLGGLPFRMQTKGKGWKWDQVSHLLFADDTLVFCKDSQDQMAVLSWLLMWFEAISVGSLPSTYLGLPLGAPHKSVVVWDGVEERMRKRLALWKRQFISKGGRLTLIWSTLASMPIYLMSLMRIPRVVRLRLEKIQRDFLWGGGLLCKWSWRFAAKRESFWKLVISSKYGEEEGGWISWDGRRVKFWKDIWCGNTPLCEAFPSLFAFAVSQDAWVEDCWDYMGDAGGWNPCFSSLLMTGSWRRCPVPWRIIWSPCVPTKVVFLLGSFLGEGPNPRSSQKEGLVSSKQMLFML